MNPPAGTSLKRAPLPVRLTKFIAQGARLPHKKVERAWWQGRVAVTNAELGAHVRPNLQDYVFPEQDVVTLDGELVSPREASAYWLLHKPAGVITTTRDPQRRAALGPWLELLPQGVFPVGRLDKETSGALMLTDDGDLAHMLLHPRFHVSKRYLLWLSTRRAPVEPRLEALRLGVTIGDGRGEARAEAIEVIGREPGQLIVAMTLREGRNRQIRKMCRAAKVHLDALHRERFGPLHLGALSPGQMVELKASDVEALWEACGGQDVVRRRSIEALRRHARRARDEGRPHDRVERWLARHDDLTRQRSMRV